MTEITKIVLTGGPCGGKTSAISVLHEQLSSYGVDVFEVNEQATSLKRSGKTPESMGTYEFHSLLFSNQLAEENAAFERAERSEKRKAVVICDRGLLDSCAYAGAGDFAKYSAAYGLNEAKIRNRYDAVFHMVTAADGAEEYYNHTSNETRSEDLVKAKELDEEILSLWVGTEHLRVIDNRGSFSDKLNRLLKEILAVLGIPEPLEIERKFLIEYPDLDFLSNMKTCRKIPITQAYLTTPEEGRFRVRKRGEGTEALYIKTIKHKINDLKRIEIEDYISEEEYKKYVANKECVEGIISKDRYCIAWHGEYFELDVYPFWNDRATLEIELLDEEQKYELPDFVGLVRDVSTEKEYRNKYLAAVYGKYYF